MHMLSTEAATTTIIGLTAQCMLATRTHFKTYVLISVGQIHRRGICRYRGLTVLSNQLCEDQTFNQSMVACSNYILSIPLFSPITCLSLPRAEEVDLCCFINRAPLNFRQVHTIRLCSLIRRL